MSMNRPAAAEAGEVERAHRDLVAERTHRRLEIVRRHAEPVNEHGMRSVLVRERAVVHAPANSHRADDIPHGVELDAVTHTRSAAQPASVRC